MQKDTRRRRLLLADDFPQILEQVERLLSNKFQIIGFARDGGEALELCLTHNPDILLLDLSIFYAGWKSQIALKNRDAVQRLFSLRSKRIVITSTQHIRLALQPMFSNAELAPIFFQPLMRH
jgi:CheY-like chemotaxis protein